MASTDGDHEMNRAVDHEHHGPNGTLESADPVEAIAATGTVSAMVSDAAKACHSPRPTAAYKDASTQLSPGPIRHQPGTFQGVWTPIVGKSMHNAGTPVESSSEAFSNNVKTPVKGGKRANCNVNKDVGKGPESIAAFIKAEKEPTTSVDGKLNMMFAVDGSHHSNIGGYGMIWKRPDDDNVDGVWITRGFKMGYCIDSVQAELMAIAEALGTAAEWVSRRGKPAGGRIRVFSDSQAALVLVDSERNGKSGKCNLLTVVVRPILDEILRALDILRKGRYVVDLMWVPRNQSFSHTWADALAGASWKDPEFVEYPKCLATRGLEAQILASATRFNGLSEEELRAKQGKRRKHPDEPDDCDDQGHPLPSQPRKYAKKKKRPRWETAASPEDETERSRVVTRSVAKAAIGGAQAPISEEPQQKHPEPIPIKQSGYGIKIPKSSLPDLPSTATTFPTGKFPNPVFGSWSAVPTTSFKPFGAPSSPTPPLSRMQLSSTSSSSQPTTSSTVPFGETVTAMSNAPLLLSAMPTNPPPDSWRLPQAASTLLPTVPTPFTSVASAAVHVFGAPGFSAQFNFRQAPNPSASSQIGPALGVGTAVAGPKMTVPTPLQTKENIKPVVLEGTCSTPCKENEAAQIVTKFTPIMIRPTDAELNAAMSAAPVQVREILRIREMARFHGGLSAVWTEELQRLINEVSRYLS